jgi:hypothetical protein
VHISQLVILDVDDDTQTVSRQAYAHTVGEVLHLAVCAAAPALVATCHARGECVHTRQHTFAVDDLTRQVFGCTVWRAPDSSADLGVGAAVGKLTAQALFTCAERTVTWYVCARAKHTY